MYGEGKLSEKFVKVAEIDLSEPDWSFNLLGVWKTDEGYYLSTDSGCSCPTPWESHTDEDLTGPLTAEQAREEAYSLWTQQADDGEEGYDPYRYKEEISKIV